MENINNFEVLFVKFLNKSISREEYDALLKYFGDPKYRYKLDELILNALLSKDGDNELSLNDKRFLKGLYDIDESKLNHKLKPKKRLSTKLKRIQ